MKLFFLISFQVVFLCASAQKKTTINFVFPDSVEVRADQYIEQQKKTNPGANFFAYLYHDSMSVFRIVILQLEKKQKLVDKWAKSSNRYAVINKKRLPLLVDYDFRFGTSDPGNMGNFGSRDGNVKGMDFMPHAFSIKFDNAKGTIISVDHF